MDDAAALGVTPGQLKVLQKQLANRDASVKQQLQEAAEAKAEKEPKRTPESDRTLGRAGEFQTID